MARKVVNRLVAYKKRQYYNNKVLRAMLTKRNFFRNINELTGKQVESEQISLRSEVGTTVDDSETVVDLFNECLATIAGNKLEQSD